MPQRPPPPACVRLWSESRQACYHPSNVRGRPSTHGCSTGQKWSAKKGCYTPTHARGRPRGCSYGRKNGRCLSKRAFESRVKSAKKRFSKARIATRLQTSFRTRRNSPNNSSSAVRIQTAMRRLSAKRKRSRVKDSLPFYPQVKTAIGKASNGTKFRTPHGIYMRVPKSVNSKGYKKLS